MIVPMKRIIVAALSSRREEVLREVARLGVVHLEHLAAPETVLPARELLTKVRQSRAILRDFVPKKAGQEGEGWEADLDAVESVLELARQREHWSTVLGQARRTLDEMAFFGDWDPAPLEALREAGLSVTLVRAQLEKGKELPPRTVLWRRRGEKVWLLCLAPELKLPAGAEEVPLPSRSRLSWVLEKEEAERQLRTLDAELKRWAHRDAGFAALERRLAWQLEWEQALASARGEGEVTIWTGYVPADRWPALREVARRQGFGVMGRDPTADEPVPTLVRNPLIPRVIEPVFKMLGIVPGYRERDISLPFLVYLLVFFAVLIGDAGYGLVFLLASLGLLFTDWRRKGRIGEGGLLLAMLSGSTIVWGALTGTWFGNLIELDRGGLGAFLRSLTLKPLVLPDGSTNQALVKFFCFTLGLSQLALGHVWNFFRLVFRERNPLKALAQLGALATTVALYPLVLTLVLPKSDLALLPVELVALNQGTPWALWPQDLSPNLAAAAFGVALVVVFGSQEGKFLQGLKAGLSGLLNTLLGAVGWFSDNISYIRLFAVGLAGYAIARSFNGMAMGALEALSNLPGLGLLVALLILLLGHGLNLAMALLSVVVHGVRLNLLEFSGRLGIEWSGIEFRPLRLDTQEGGGTA